MGEGWTEREWKGGGGRGRSKREMGEERFSGGDGVRKTEGKSGRIVRGEVLGEGG